MMTVTLPRLNVFFAMALSLLVGSALPGQAATPAASETPETYIHMDPVHPQLTAKTGDIIGKTVTYTIGKKETLLDIARYHGIGYLEMISANPNIDPWIPQENLKVILPTANLLPNVKRQGLVINLAEQRLYYFSKKRKQVLSFAIGVGRDGLETPNGTTKIIRKKEGPTWRPTARMRAEDPELPAVVPPGPDNPLGSHALYLGWPQYLIHGTSKPYGVGRRVSSGCIRLYPEGISYLYDIAAKNTKVTVIDQPIKVGWSQGELYLEAHPSQSQADYLETNGVLKTEEVPDIFQRILAYAKSEKNRIDWDLVQKTLAKRQGYPIQITWPDPQYQDLDFSLIDHAAHMRTDLPEKKINTKTNSKTSPSLDQNPAQQPAPQSSPDPVALTTPAPLLNKKLLENAPSTPTPPSAGTSPEKNKKSSDPEFDQMLDQASEPPSPPIKGKNENAKDVIDGFHWEG